jgi:hypothetical protein
MEMLRKDNYIKIADLKETAGDFDDSGFLRNF